MTRSEAEDASTAETFHKNSAESRKQDQKHNPRVRLSSRSDDIFDIKPNLRSPKFKFQMLDFPAIQMLHFPAFCSRSQNWSLHGFSTLFFGTKQQLLHGKNSSEVGHFVEKIKFSGLFRPGPNKYVCLYRLRNFQSVAYPVDRNDHLEDRTQSSGGI